jgi:hypothetical protein
MAKLLDHLDSSEFRPRYSFYVKVADILGLSDEASARVCSFINYIQTQRTRNEKTGESVPDEIEYFLKKSSSDEALKSKSERLLTFVRENRLALSRLFSELSEHDFSSKVHGLETGPIAHLKSLRTYCDIRPVYNIAADAIVSCFPIITLRLLTHNGETDETQDVLVQLVESDIKDIKQQFDRLDKKLAKLNTQFSSLLANKKREDK